MRKGMAVLGALLLTLCIAGCGSSSKEVKYLCEKEDSGVSFKTTLTFKEDKLTTYVDEQLSTIVDASYVDQYYQDVVAQLDGQRSLYPGATIEAVKDGNKVGLKREFDFSNHTYDKLTLDFTVSDTKDNIISVLTGNGHTCNEVK